MQPLKNILNWISKKFSDNPQNMLIITGVAGWTLSSIAQIGAVLFNPKISKEQKSFLIPQEFADGLVNISLFFLITQAAKNFTSNLFKTGKFAPSNVRKFLEKNFKNEVGKIDFDVEKACKGLKGFDLNKYEACKNFYTSVATVTAGILSSNILTPIIRNEMATKMQKNYINNSNNNEIKKPNVKLQTYAPSTLKSYGMRV